MKKHVFTWLLTAILMPAISFAQATKPIINSTLEGAIVDDKTRNPLAGAVIHIKGTTHEVASDGDGKFNFRTGQKLPYTLIVSFVGYQTQEIVVATSPVEIGLKETANQLNDIVVVGYGTQRRKDITGSIASVNKEALNQVTPSVDNLLRGAAPGVVVTQSSGQPGASASIRIRGGNSITGGNEPLYVIDGFPVYNDNSNASTGASYAGAGLNVLATINPADIESIDILKDASATAIYGSRGANGVVIITTKKGTKGTNNVSYQGYYGTQKVAKQLDLLNAKQWAELRNDISASINQAPYFTQAQIDSLGGPGVGSDWQDAALRRASVQNHQLTFSGGDNSSRYAVSGNYFSQDGVLKGSGFDRYSLRINYEKNISSKFKIGVNATGSYASLNGMGANNSGASLLAPNTLAGVVLISPVVPIYNADGSFNVTKNPFASPLNGYISNPIADLESTVNEVKINRTLASVFADYKLLKTLSARVTINADLTDTKQNYYAPSYTTNGLSTKGLASVGGKRVVSWLNENTLTYSPSIGDNHSLTVLGGYTTQYTTGDVSLAGATNFVNDVNTYKALQDGTPSRPSSDSYESILNSWLGRINYSLLGKYNLTVSARADGSSRFGANSKWGYYPSAGFSWNIIEENFAKSIHVLSDAKLRLSAGSTGNQEIGDYLYLARLGATNYPFGGAIKTGFAPIRLSNPDLKWEKTNQYDLGLDLGLFGNRVNLVFDVYYKKTTDLLINVPIPLTSGFASVLQNIGSVENKGIELGINTNNIRNGKLSWKTSLVYSVNRNKVLEIGNGTPQFYPDVPNAVLKIQQPVIVKVGEPLGTFWGYKTNGIFQTTDDLTKLPSINTPANTKFGDQRYIDENGDGRITAADKVNLGSSQPKFTGGLTNIFNYANIELLVFFQGSYGNKIYNAINQQLEIPTLGTNGSAVLANRWTPTNPTNDVPRAASSPASVVSDRYIENGSYLRLKTLTLGYSFPKSVVSKINAKNIKLYLSSQNLFTWTKYKGYDPEVSSFEQNSTLSGIDYGAYPNSRTFIAGLNVTF